MGPWCRGEMWRKTHLALGFSPASLEELGCVDDRWWLCRDVLLWWRLLSPPWWPGFLWAWGISVLGYAHTTHHTVLPLKRHISTNR